MCTHYDYVEHGTSKEDEDASMTQDALQYLCCNPILADFGLSPWKSEKKTIPRHQQLRVSEDQPKPEKLNHPRIVGTVLYCTSCSSYCSSYCIYCTVHVQYPVQYSTGSTTVDSFVSSSVFKDPHAIPAPRRCQRALSTPLQPNHTINTINSNTYHLLEKVTKIHKRQVYNPKNE